MRSVDTLRLRSVGGKRCGIGVCTTARNARGTTTDEALRKATPSRHGFAPCLLALGCALSHGPRARTPPGRPHPKPCLSAPRGSLDGVRTCGEQRAILATFHAASRPEVKLPKRRAWRMPRCPPSPHAMRAPRRLHYLGRRGARAHALWRRFPPELGNLLASSTPAMCAQNASWPRPTLAQPCRPSGAGVHVAARSCLGRGSATNNPDNRSGKLSVECASKKKEKRASR